MSVLDFDHVLGGGRLGGRDRFGIFGGGRRKNPWDIEERPHAYAQAPEQPRQGGFFGQGGAGRGIAGSIGDFLLQYNGMRPIYAPQQRQKQYLEQQQKLAEQQRMAGLQDYRTKKQIDQEFADNSPDIGVFEDNAGNRYRYDKRTGMPIDDKPFFVDPAQKFYFQNGAMVNVPNPYASPQQGGYAEGTIIENDAGERQVLRNGQWVPMGGSGGNAGGGF